MRAAWASSIPATQRMVPAWVEKRKNVLARFFMFKMNGDNKAGSMTPENALIKNAQELQCCSMSITGCCVPQLFGTVSARKEKYVFVTIVHTGAGSRKHSLAL
ncbi:hypothetical protein [Desulfosarcina sp. BuS5]|uniref:hypothetical protein n=1 Tax=Desulfosarcina sp. BuS5 TaxID=933262 RepID=UPI00047F95F8|nr:hypothetical protein [Desulfosarcina sp. BuS5]